MSLITINADFHDLVSVLRDIRDILLRAFPDKSQRSVKLKPAGPENLTEFDPEQEWKREQEEEARWLKRMG